VPATTPAATMADIAARRVSLVIMIFLPEYRIDQLDDKLCLILDILQYFLQNI
jgi:hypothetical protein